MGLKMTGCKSIFITGAASGMGKATAEFFKAKDWFIFCSDIDKEKLIDLENLLGNDNIIYRHLDVTDKNQYEECINSLSKRTNNKLDILFNNAGMTEGGFFEDIPYENHMKLININIIGVINGIYCAIDLLKNTPNSLCISTSSSTGIIGLGMAAVYSASKHAVKGLTESLSSEFLRFDTRVSDILPGVIDTPMISDDIKKKLPKDGMWRLTPSIEIAKAVWDSYHSDKMHWYVPKELEELELTVAESPEKTRDNLKNSGPLS